MSTGEPPVLAHGQPFWVRIRGWIFWASLLISALLGTIFIITPLLPLMYMKPQAWRKCMDRLVGIWVVMAGAMMGYVFGANVRVRGDMIDHSKPAVILMNHRSRLDWLYFWEALFKMDPWLCTSEKIILKGILKFIPGADVQTQRTYRTGASGVYKSVRHIFGGTDCIIRIVLNYGWAMGANAYIFLERRFDTDKSRIDKIIRYFSQCGYNYQILLYPEGTDKCPRATERSRRYAEKNNLVHYDYVLHPRTTGFVRVIQNMRRAGYLDTLYDVTIGFGDCIVQSELDFALYGVCPKEVYYQVRKIEISDLPLDNEKLAKWLINLWKGKEEKLRRFYALDPKERHFDNTPNGRDYEMSRDVHLIQVCILSFWIATTLIWVYGFLMVPYMRMFSFVSCAIYTFIQCRWGGMEWLSIELFNNAMRSNRF